MKMKKITPISDWFFLAHEIIQIDPDDPEMKVLLEHGLCNAIDLWPPLSDKMLDLIRSRGFGLMVFMPSIPSYLRGIVAGGCPQAARIIPTIEFVKSELAKMERITEQGKAIVFWDIMPEFDTAFTFGFGGEIIRNKLRFFSREEACQALERHILKQPLLSEIVEKRRKGDYHVQLAAVSGNPYTTHYVYEWGLDIGLLERCNDSEGDIQTGIAFVRGAGRQYAKPWGIDLSHCAGLRAQYDPSVDGFEGDGTGFNEKMQRVKGWSPSYVRRHWYISYFSGANFIRQECAFARKGYGRGFMVVMDGSSGEARLTPIGKEAVTFADFALRKHPNRGKPYVPVALMLDLNHGWKPKHANASQERVWFGQLPYNDGNYMMENFFKVIFPEHELSGSAPNAPWKSGKEYIEMIKSGLDTQPYEPMGTSPWGDSFDVILSNASLDALRQYSAVILLGQIKINGGLSERLKTYAEEGGIIVANIKQVNNENESLFGVHLLAGEKHSDVSRCLICDRQWDEETYHYGLIEPVSAEVIAGTPDGDPLITRFKMGKGEAVLTTPFYLQDNAGRALLKVGQDLIGHLMNRLALVQIKGSPVEYMVNRTADGVICVIVNNSGNWWTGKVRVNVAAKNSRLSLSEWICGQKVGFETKGNQTIFDADVPAYDLRVYFIQGKILSRASYPGKCMSV